MLTSRSLIGIRQSMMAIFFEFMKVHTKDQAACDLEFTIFFFFYNDQTYNNTSTLKLLMAIKFAELLI